METLNRRLRRLRLNRGLTIKEVAQSAKVSPSTYREWEYGRSIRGEPYARLAEVLGVSLSELLTGERRANDDSLQLLGTIEQLLRKLRAELTKIN